MRPFPSTYSLLIRSENENSIGVVTQSKYLAIGGLVQCYVPSFGACIAQGWPNLSLAQSIALRISNKDEDIKSIEHFLQDDELKDYRQLAFMPESGHGFAYSGQNLKSITDQLVQNNIVGIGNLLQSDKVISEMIKNVRENENKTLLRKLVEGIMSGLNAGGEIRGQQSAAIKIWSLGQNNDIPTVDLRVDDSDEAIEDLYSLVEKYELYFGDIETVVPANVVTNLVKKIMTNALYKNPRYLVKTIEDLYRFENLENRWISDERFDMRALDFLKSKYL